MDKTAIKAAIKLLQRAVEADNAYDTERLVCYAQVEIAVFQDRPEAARELSEACKARAL